MTSTDPVPFGRRRVRPAHRAHDDGHGARRPFLHSLSMQSLLSRPRPSSFPPLFAHDLPAQFVRARNRQKPLKRVQLQHLIDRVVRSVKYSFQCLSTQRVKVRIDNLPSTLSADIDRKLGLPLNEPPPDRDCLLNRIASMIHHRGTERDFGAQYEASFVLRARIRLKSLNRLRVHRFC